MPLNKETETEILRKVFFLKCEIEVIENKIINFNSFISLDLWDEAR